MPATVILRCQFQPRKRIRHAQIYKDQNPEQSKNQNFIYFNEDSSVILFEDDYKTRDTYGPNQTDLTLFTFLTYYLKLYCTKLKE